MSNSKWTPDVILYSWPRSKWQISENLFWIGQWPVFQMLKPPLITQAAVIWWDPAVRHCCSDETGRLGCWSVKSSQPEEKLVAGERDFYYCSSCSSHNPPSSLWGQGGGSPSDSGWGWCAPRGWGSPHNPRTHKGWVNPVACLVLDTTTGLGEYLGETGCSW